MVIVGLTGGIGSGKSTVASMLAGRGAAVIDCDQLGREVIGPGGLAERPVRERFGSSVVGPNGHVDRRALAAAVFGDPAALAELTAISHPAINAMLGARLLALKLGDGGRPPPAVVVLDMAVLVESQLGVIDGAPVYDPVVVVEAPWPARLERLRARGMAEADAVARRDAQATDADRRRRADVIIRNDGDLAALERHVDRLWSTVRGGPPPPAG
jgi:dephospho-CoA kinase